MNIGIVGLGVVGTAIAKGFEDLGHDVFGYDIKYKDTELLDVLDTDIIYLCLPTNSKEDGSCNTDSIKETLKELTRLNYEGIVAVKSTIIPGTYEELRKLFSRERLCLVPEFLREKYAYEDFTNRHNVLVIGSENVTTYKTVIQSHGHYPKAIQILTPYECEFVKYFSNVYKAYKTVFANSFGKLCKMHNVNYDNVLNTFLLEGVEQSAYLEYFDGQGFGGMCLPKDTKALVKLAENTNIDTFKFILSENDKFN